MSHDLIPVAEAIKSSLVPAERRQGRAAVEAARCLAAVLEAHSDARLPLYVGAEAIKSLAKGTWLAIEARQAFIDAHRELATLIPEVGLQEAGWGCTSPDCPVDIQTQPTELKLKVVA